MNKRLFIIIPCYNEEEVLPWTLQRLTTLVEQLNETHHVDTTLLLVDDGSRDATWHLISEAAARYAFVAGLKLAHNVGHQNALWAGMEQALPLCDAAVSIDADLQDNPDTILSMTEQWLQGTDIVYGVRKERKTDTWFKRVTALGFYRVMQMADRNMLYNHADFRLMSHRALKALMQYPERNMFLRGIVRQLGFNEGFVYYDRTARTAGESKYPLRKMLSFSIDGITSFSTGPLKFITFAGLTMTLVALCIIIYALYEHIIGNTIEGWTSILVSMWFIGGVITTGVGITGVYIGKIYTEVKRRPRYFVDKTLNMNFDEGVSK